MKPDSLYARVTGHGPPAVFIHGAGATGRVFSRQYQAFKESTRSHFVDLPGHGGAAPVGDLSIAGYAAAVVQFVDRIGEPVVLVGHSMGGGVALEAAARRPGGVQRLVLVGAGCELPAAQIFAAALEADYARALDGIIRASFTLRADSALVDRARADLQSMAPGVVRADFRACAQLNACDQASSVRCPTLIICGADDLMTPPDLSVRLHSLIPGARLEIVPRAGHMVMIESPEDFNEILGEFLRS